MAVTNCCSNGCSRDFTMRSWATGVGGSSETQMSCELEPISDYHAEEWRWALELSDQDQPNRKCPQLHFPRFRVPPKARRHASPVPLPVPLVPSRHAGATALLKG